MRTVLSVAVVVSAIVAFWYAACIPMNIHMSVTEASRAGIAVSPEVPAEARAMGGIALAVRNPDAWQFSFGQDRPKLPAPHQVTSELWATTVEGLSHIFL